MIRDITIGQYYPAKSVLHRLDPRTKFLGTLGFLAEVDKNSVYPAPKQLTDGLERLLRPLNKIRVPVHEIAMMMSIALRFIPILLEETDKIMKAQIARGADFENGNLIQKAKNMVPLLVPLFISAFRRANDLAMAMEARCYHGGEHRTQMKPQHYEKRDYAAYGILVAYLAVGVAFRVAGL